MSEFTISCLVLSLGFLLNAFLLSYPVASYKGSRFYIVTPHRMMTRSEETWIYGCKFWQRASLILAFVYTAMALVPSFYAPAASLKFSQVGTPLLSIVGISYYLFNRAMNNKFDSTGRRIK